VKSRFAEENSIGGDAWLAVSWKISLLGRELGVEAAYKTTVPALKSLRPN